MRCSACGRETASPELLNATELAARLGLGHSRFHQLRKRGAFKHLETLRPLGVRKYSRVLVDHYLAGRSTTQLGRRTA